MSRQRPDKARRSATPVDAQNQDVTSSNTAQHPTGSPLEPDSRSAVGLRGLTKSFGSVAAVRDLDLDIAAGEIVAVLGPNGAGKSTTTEMILGITDPDAGEVRVFGLRPRAAVLAGRVGAMLQAGALLAEATVSDVLQLMHGLHRRPLPLDQVIERAAIGSFLRTKTDKLSGGQAQRLRYALAIMPDPDLLILDEPTVGMDVEVRRNVLGLDAGLHRRRPHRRVRDPLPGGGRCRRRPHRRPR